MILCLVLFTLRTVGYTIVTKIVHDEAGFPLFTGTRSPVQMLQLYLGIELQNMHDVSRLVQILIYMEFIFIQLRICLMHFLC
jgi:hypothetical protein